MQRLRLLPLFFLLAIALGLPIMLSVVTSIDAQWLLNAQLDLVSTSGTMASISLAILSLPFVMRNQSIFLYRLWVRFLVIVSILYFLVGAGAGLLYRAAGADSYILLSAPFWFTLCGIISLTLLAFTFLSAGRWWEGEL